MKRMLVLILLLPPLALCSAQTEEPGERLTTGIVHPWWVVAGGGGSSGGGGLTLRTSAGQPVVAPMTGTGFTLEPGYIPPLRVLAGTATTMTQNVAGGWNLISVPLIVDDCRKTVLYPTAVSPAFRFENGYLTTDTLENGAGYWLKFDSGQVIPVTGTTLTLDTVDVRGGWNIVGGPSYPVLASGVVPVPPLTIVSAFYGFNGGYQPLDTLPAGNGFWVKLSQAGRLVMQSGSVLASPPLAAGERDRKTKARLTDLMKNPDVTTLVLRDAAGKTHTLYFCADREQVDLASCELPPPPPAGTMDVRYLSQRAAEAYDPERGGEQSFPIQITDATYPLTASWSLGGSEGTYGLEIASSGRERERVPLRGHGEVRLESAVRSLALTVHRNASREVPSVFVLFQNYPNPFNPSTTVRFGIPVDSRVIVEVYNTLGQRVRVLTEGTLEAGYHDVVWNGTDGAERRLASGVYLVRLTATGKDGRSYAAARKAMLLK